MTPDFFSLAYLDSGSSIQQKGAKVIKDLGVMNILRGYDPVLAGTLPLDLFTAESDLDILCFSLQLSEVEKNWKKNFGTFEDFSLRLTDIKGNNSLVANFKWSGFKFELFAQGVPTFEQAAYVHMVNEFKLLQRHGPLLREKVMALKQKGIKTEPAFAQALGLPGDPYDTLLSHPL